VRCALCIWITKLKTVIVSEATIVYPISYYSNKQRTDVRGCEYEAGGESCFISIYMVVQAFASVNLGERGSGLLSFLRIAWFCAFCSAGCMDCASGKTDVLTDNESCETDVLTDCPSCGTDMLTD
jgi:hypothetical protein